MTPIYISVHDDGSFSWIDNDVTVECATMIPGKVWDRVPPDERARVNRRREKIRAYAKPHPSQRKGLKVAALQRMMAERWKAMRANHG